MKNYAGLDVSLEETAIAIMDETGRTVREAKVASEIAAIDAWLGKTGIAIDRLGLEAGPLSSWLHAGLKERGWPAICIETRRLRAVTRAMPVKSDRKDAEAIAQVMRTGWYRPVHVKSLASQQLRVLLRHRKILQAKRQDLENELRGTLKAFGLKLGRVGRAKFAQRVGELVAGEPWLERLALPMLAARTALLESFGELHALVLRIVKADAVCRRLMTIPGIGAVNALAYKTGIDDPTRFRHSDPQTLRVRPDRAGRADQQMRRRHGPQPALRGRHDTAPPRQGRLDTQALGTRARQEDRHPQGRRRARPTPRRHHASHVARRHRLQPLSRPCHCHLT